MDKSRWARDEGWRISEISTCLGNDSLAHSHLVQADGAERGLDDVSDRLNRGHILRADILSALTLAGDDILEALHRDGAITLWRDV